MSDTNTPQSSQPVDILAALKTVPDIQSRVALAVLAILSLFVPIASKFAHWTLIDTVGSFSFVLPILAILVLVAPVFPSLKANSRLIEIANGAAAAIAAFMVVSWLVDVGFAPSWGAIIFLAYLVLSANRGLKAIRVKPPAPQA